MPIKGFSVEESSEQEARAQPADRAKAHAHMVEATLKVLLDLFKFFMIFFS